MGIKDFFDKGHSLKFLKNKSQDDVREDLESSRFVDAYVTRRERFFPNVDFATASNFANFGSAELYYSQAIERIYKTYPYDGSLAEKIEWENNSNYIDLFVYENDYPRTNGYITINPTASSYTTTEVHDPTDYIYSSSAPEYVLIKGGPHPDPSGDFKSPASAGQKQNSTSKANIYHTASQRTNNLELDPVKGITVEYWCKKDGWVTAPDGRAGAIEYFFNVANTGSSGGAYGNLRAYAKGTEPTDIYIAYDSGSVSISSSFDTGLSTLADGNWHHHALTMKKISGKSVKFDGIDDFISFGQPSNLNFDPDDDSFTLSAWIKTTSHGSIIGISSDFSDGDPDAQYRMYVRGPGATAGKLYGAVGGNSNVSISDSVVNDGNWHHCVLVSNTTTHTLYVDGAPQLDAGVCGSTMKPGFDLLVGARRDGGSNKDIAFLFDGYIDEVTVWSDALSAAEVTELYNSGTYINPKKHSVYVADNSKLVSWWEMGDGASASDVTTILDSAGSNIGNLYNANPESGVTTISNFESYGQFELYLDGEHKSTKAVGATSLGAVDGAIVGAIGALATEKSASSAVGNISAGFYAGRGWGNIVSASFDEFRYWKTRRSAQQIGRYYKDQVGAGTNTDNVKYDNTDYLIDLGVYYKFNEGILGSASVDQTILDYSGRISNGVFVNYRESGATPSRNTGSAIVLADAGTKEYKDPILYSSHPDVVALAESRKILGAVHDHQNVTSLYRTLPAWISEADETHSNHLRQLTQIMASYFDELFLQIQSLPRIKDINYPYDVNFEKPLPFADRLLSTRGTDAPELFADADALAKFLDRDEKILFEKKLYEVKNTIYQNIYNNLTYIQKSKGTAKSIRNLLRCFGVDEELVRVNVYPKNETYEFKDNVSHMALRKKYADFDDPETRMKIELGYSNAYSATVYQYYDSSDSNSLSFIPAFNMDATAEPGSLAATLEAEVIFPKRSIKDDLNSSTYPDSAVSLFGLHLITSDTEENMNQNFNFAVDDSVNFQVQAIKSDDDNRSVKFKLVGGSDIEELITTSSFKGVYDNEKWNLAVRIKPVIHPLADKILSPTIVDYTIELYGVNYISDTLQNEFTLTAANGLTKAAAIKFFESAKRVFAGAHRTSFNGDLITPSDVKISSVRMWYDYLEDEVIRAHARNAASFGRLQPYKNTLFGAGSKGDLDAGTAGAQTLWQVRIPEIETLLLHWDFTNVTGSDANGQFAVDDISSGSVDDRTNKRYGVMSDINTYLYPARGDHFVVSTSEAVDLEFVPTAKQRLPEIANSDDMVKILNQQDDIVFTRDTTYVQHLISVEKSMYQVISDKMVNMFGTIVGFNNLVGDPVNRYRPSYKQLEKLRSIFFEGVENEPDLDKFVEYFKWIDDAVTFFIFQLIPASANKVEFLRNMVESHILERNKYFHKFPTIEMDKPEPFEQFKGINELLYNWKYGHAPVGTAAEGTIITCAEAQLVDTKDFTITDAAGVTTTYNISMGGNIASNTGAYIPGTTTSIWFGDLVDLTAAGVRDQIIARISAGTAIGFTAAANGNNITVTQGTAGSDGNKSFTEPDGDTGLDFTNFTNGTGHAENTNCFWWKNRAERSGVLTSGDASVDSNKDIILKTIITELSGNDTLALSYGSSPKTQYSASYYYDRALSKLVHLDSDIIKSYKGGSNPDDQQKPDFYKGVIKFGSDNDFVWLDRDHELPTKDCIDEIIPDAWPKNKKRRIIKAFTMTADDLSSSNADGTGKDDYKPTDDKSTRLLPFNMYSSSFDSFKAKDYNADYDLYFSGSTEFTNYHHDSYRPTFEVPMQGPFTNQHVGGNQYRHAYLNQPSVTAGDGPGIDNFDNRMSRPEGWALVMEGSGELLSDSKAFDMVLDFEESIGAISKVLVLDIPFSSEYNMPPEMSGSSPTLGASEPPAPTGDDPSEEDRFVNITNHHTLAGASESGWKINQQGPSSANSGPLTGDGSAYYAVAAPQSNLDDLGRIFGLRTPMVDLLDADYTPSSGDTAYLEFKYHMYGLPHGNLSVQYSYESDFSDGGVDLTTVWDYGGTNTSAVSLSGQQQTSQDADWKTARIDLDSLAKTRFFVRFVYFSPIIHNADCALDNIQVVINAGSTTESDNQFSNVTNHHTFTGASESGWKINQQGPSSANSGPLTGDNSTYYAVAAPQPTLDDLGRIFGLRTPMIDLLSNADFVNLGESAAYLEFKYHMYGLPHGNLSVQYSYESDFSDGGTDFTTTWDVDGTQSSATSLSGQQQTSQAADWKRGQIDISSLIKTKFFVRFVYFSPIIHNADCALDNIKILTTGFTAPFPALGPYGSLRLLHPTHDDHNRPYAVHTREELAKRPVNIRNIQIGSLTPAQLDSTDKKNHMIASIVGPREYFGSVLPATKAGNYYNRYEYVNTFGREANDPYFVKKEGDIYEASDAGDNSTEPSGTYQQEIASMYLTTLGDTGLGAGYTLAASSFGTEGRLLSPARGKNYKLPDRTEFEAWKYRVVVGSDVIQHQKNKTRFVNRFSSPGDILDSSRGFFTTPHEVFAVHNALPWRNYHLRKHCHSMLAAHSGKFGVSAHSQFADYSNTSSATPGVAFDQVGSTAHGRIWIKDWNKLPSVATREEAIAEGPHLTMFDAGGNKATFNFSSAVHDANDDYASFPYLVELGDDFVDTLGRLEQAILVAFGNTNLILVGSLQAPATQGYYDEYLDKRDYYWTILSEINSVLGYIDLMQGIPGSVGNQPIICAVSSSALVVNGFYGGKDATSRVYETTTLGTTFGSSADGSLAAAEESPTGTIHKEDYSITSGSASNSSDKVHRASAHKRHRNRGDRLVYGKNVDQTLDSLSTSGGGIAHGSQYDNAYVSHTIPRTNDQVAWIKAIAELDLSIFEQLDPNSPTYGDIEAIVKSGTGRAIPYLGIEQGTEVGS